LDVTKLGPHIGTVISRHLDRHASRAREAAEERREEKLGKLFDTLKPLIEREELTGSGVTKPYEVQRLDGTVAAAVLGGHRKENGVSSVRDTAKELCFGKDGYSSDGALYISQGPMSGDPKFTSELLPYKEMVARGGLTVDLSLETPHQEGDLEPTREVAMTPVAILLDPESIFIVDELRGDQPEQPDQLYGRVIGPSDERFGLVMSMVERVAQGGRG